jgi:hypothetical protein
MKALNFFFTGRHSLSIFEKNEVDERTIVRLFIYVSKTMLDVTSPETFLQCKKKGKHLLFDFYNYLLIHSLYLN